MKNVKMSASHIRSLIEGAKYIGKTYIYWCVDDVLTGKPHFYRQNFYLYRAGLRDEIEEVKLV